MQLADSEKLVALRKQESRRRSLLPKVFAAALILWGCSDNPQEQPPTPTPTEFPGFIPVRTFCRNREDFITAQSDGTWKFVEMEIVDGVYKEVRTEVRSSESEALSLCVSK